MEISFSSYPNSTTMIATKFCTCHDSITVMACANICSNLMADNWITAAWIIIIHPIWILIRKKRCEVGPSAYITRKWKSNLHHCLIMTRGIKCCQTDNLQCLLWQGGHMDDQPFHSNAYLQQQNNQLQYPSYFVVPLILRYQILSKQIMKQ